MDLGCKHTSCCKRQKARGKRQEGKEVRSFIVQKYHTGLHLIEKGYIAIPVGIVIIVDAIFPTPYSLLPTPFPIASNA
ncbi:hypothetical protein [Moorena producens]|uniref:hypothetical protein n=1 Tax=Moorena producens TaxID=1155739 RepID=UPI0011EA719C|nr:hypothetical protein [Moorena producens]NEO94270.1 hypothetical protein [Moorena sp. SIO3G5]